MEFKYDISVVYTLSCESFFVNHDEKTSDKALHIPGLIVSQLTEQTGVNWELVIIDKFFSVRHLFWENFMYNVSEIYKKQLNWKCASISPSYCKSMSDSKDSYSQEYAMNTSLLLAQGKYIVFFDEKSLSLSPDCLRNFVVGADKGEKRGFLLEDLLAENKDIELQRQRVLELFGERFGCIRWAF